MLKESKMIYELIAVERGHFYVCGDCKMAENVCQTLKSIIQEQAGMNSAQSDNFMLGLRVRWSACTRFMVVVGTVRRVGRNISHVFFFDFRICLSDAISIRMRGFFPPRVYINYRVVLNAYLINTTRVELIFYPIRRVVAQQWREYCPITCRSIILKFKFLARIIRVRSHNVRPSTR